ncbi:uncharacterized protein TRAVEDRAFT_121219, partial [Trametes versicolor FP-101664 SS1]|uniref:uncharacterized protein n=1 Tax=Trametes versicolor (strain FP-101664) TaxID=717944 RepID=UPI00046243C7
SGNDTTTFSASGNATTTTASNGTVISFPSITSASMNFTSLSTSTIPLTSTPSVNSEFTFVTQSSLFIAPTSSSTPTTTATDPDTPVTTLSISPVSSQAADTKPTAPALPTNLPLQIFPAEGSHPGDPDLSNYSLISILFDSALNWKFVAQNSTSSSQIFAWMSPILQTALNLTQSQIKTYELKVYAPSDYTGPDDIALLQTMWLGWIPGQTVDDLAQQLKVTSSLFYTALPSPYKDLAEHVVSSFPVTNAPGSTSTDTNSGGSSGASSSASSSSKTREDAIIGVVSSLGAIALLILAFLVFRAVKQRRELAHRRLSDAPGQNEFIGAPPEEDHEFDRDSVGGQRRRSFYYAADSLRGAEPQAPVQQVPAYSEDPFNPTMRERRPPIGAPILRDNTMNW